jgi:phosphoribosylformylglycinamidine (FGAM) synthase-like amidotransferase family enzyme
MKFGVLVFPGSNCDHDTYNVIAEVAHQPVTFLWHDSEDLQGVDAVWFPAALPTAITCAPAPLRAFLPSCRRSSALPRAAAGAGHLQRLPDSDRAGLLPGALMRNAGLKYICKQVHLRTETADSPFTNQLAKGDVLQMPIGHMEGNYFCTPEELHQLEAEDRIAFRYATPQGEITPEANPNGSLSNIAGILNAKRNVLGMMPHPDRSSELILGSADGWKIFASMIEALAARC